MLTSLFLVLCVACVYVSLRYPEWFWTATIGSTALLGVAAAAAHQNPDSIQLGFLSGRSTDPAVLAVLVGTVYHTRKDPERWGAQFLTRSPVGLIAFAMCAFLLIKVLFSLMFRYDDIMASRGVSHAVGGIIAALGDVRDILLPYIPLVYVYAARKSRDFKLLGRPFIVLVLILLAKGLIGVLTPGNVPAGSTDVEHRFLPSDDAIHLTIFGFALFFLPVQKVGRSRLVLLGVTALIVATLANHRSQWLGLLAGLAVFLLIHTFGPRIVKNAKIVRVGFTAGLLLMAIIGIVAVHIVQDGNTRLLPSYLVKRLYAFTDPSRDPDADFREKLWQSRIEQVGDDWPWGRPFGARPETLMRGIWFPLPSHSAYVSMYEAGGVIFCFLAFLFWGRVVQVAWMGLARHQGSRPVWPPALALITAATSLAYGTAYFFPMLAPAFVVMLTFESVSQEAGDYRFLRSRSLEGVPLPHLQL